MFSGRVVAVDSGFVEREGVAKITVGWVRTFYENGMVVKWEKGKEWYKLKTNKVERVREELEKEWLRKLDGDLKLFDGCCEEFIGVIKSSRVGEENIFRKAREELKDGERKWMNGRLMYKWRDNVYGLCGKIDERYFEILPKKLGYPLELLEADRIARIRNEGTTFPRLFRGIKRIRIFEE